MGVDESSRRGVRFSGSADVPMNTLIPPAIDHCLAPSRRRTAPTLTDRAFPRRRPRANDASATPAPPCVPDLPQGDTNVPLPLHREPPRDRSRTSSQGCTAPRVSLFRRETIPTYCFPIIASHTAPIRIQPTEAVLRPRHLLALPDRRIDGIPLPNETPHDRTSSSRSATGAPRRAPAALPTDTSAWLPIRYAKLRAHSHTSARCCTAQPDARSRRPNDTSAPPQRRPEQRHGRSHTSTQGRSARPQGPAPPPPDTNARLPNSRAERPDPVRI